MRFGIHVNHLPFSKVLEGFLFGAIFFGVISAGSTLLLNILPEDTGFCPSLSSSVCIPLTLYSTLLSSSWGPAMLIYLATWPRVLTQIQSQFISATFFGLIAGILSFTAGRKVGIIFFLVAFVVSIGITAFWVALVIFTG